MVVVLVEGGGGVGTDCVAFHIFKGSKDARLDSRSSEYGFRLVQGLTMPCCRVLIRTKQLSMAVTARVLYLCACVRYQTVAS